MEDADSVLGDIKVEEMYALGNAWIQLGDVLHERRVAVNGHVDGIGMTGAAGDEARRAWEEGLALTFDAAAEKAWTIGQTINRYADELYKAAEEYAEQLNAAMWADILGVIFGLVLIGLGPLLARVMSLVGSLLARLIPIVTAIGSRLGTVGGAIAGAVGGAVVGAGTEVALDLGLGALGAEIAGADFDVTWTVAISAIVGAGFGAHGGGLMGWHYGGGGRSFVPKPTPGGDAPPASVPPGVTPSTVKPMPGGGDGSVPPPSRTPDGDLSLTTPDGLGRGDGSLAPPPSGGRDGVSVKDSNPTNSGPGNGRSGDLGMPAQATKSDGSSTALLPTPLPGRGNSPTETPGSAPPPGPAGRDGGSTPAPQPPVTTRPVGSRDGAGVTPPVTRRPDGSRVTLPDSLGGGQRDPYGQTSPRPDGSSKLPSGDTGVTSRPPAPPVRAQSGDVGSGHRLGGGQNDPFGQLSSRPDGSSKLPGGDTSAPVRAQSGDVGSGRRLGGGQRDPYGQLSSRPDGSSKLPGGDTSAPVRAQSGDAGSGRRLGGGQRDPFGQTSPRPDGSSKLPGSDTGATSRPPARSGPGYDRPAKLDDIPGWKPPVGSKGSGAGEGNLRANNGSDSVTYTTTHSSGDQPAGQRSARSGGDDARPSSSRTSQSSGNGSRNLSPDESGQGPAGRDEGRDMSPAEARKPDAQLADARRDDGSATEQRPASDRPVTEPLVSSGHRGSGTTAGDNVRPSSPDKARPSGKTADPKADPTRPPSTGDTATHSARTPNGDRLGAPSAGNGRDAEDGTPVRIPGQTDHIVPPSAPSHEMPVSPVPATTPDRGTAGPIAASRVEDSTSSEPVGTPPRTADPGTGAERGGRTTLSHRHPGRARFDIDAARARLADPGVSPERREESVLWAERAVLDRIQQVAPDQNPLGVVARPEEVVELVAAEHLRAGHLPATALLGSLVRGPEAAAQPAAQPQPQPRPEPQPEPEAGARPQSDSEHLPALPVPDGRGADAAASEAVPPAGSIVPTAPTSWAESTAIGSASGPVAASGAETVLPGSSDESPESSSSTVPGSAGEGEDRLGSESEGPDVLFAPPARGAEPDPIRDWLRISESGGSRRSSALRAIDRAVSRLPRDAGTEDLRRVLVSVTEWKSDKGPESRRWDAVSRLEAAVRDRMDQLAPPARVSVRDRVEQRASGRTPVRGGYSAQPGPSSRRGEPPVVAPLVSAAPGAVEGFGPASGLEAELHRYRVELPRGAEVEEFGDIVELPGLLTITLDKAGGVPVPEIVTKPARGLVRGPADGRAERSEVQAAVNDVMSRLRHARPGARIGQIFPESAGYVVDPLAEDLPVRINEAGYATLVHHTATAPTSRLVAFIEHVRGRMRRESPPVQIAHADAGAGLAFGAWARQDFARWLSQYPRWADAANPWDGDELEGVIALGYTQVAATVRGATLDWTQRPKDLTAVASRDSLAALRSSIGEGPRAYLEHRARSIAARFAETVVRGGSVLDLPLTMSRGPLRATVGQYLDNLLLHRPERFVSQYEALGIRTDFHTLDANPDRRGRALIVPAVVRLEARSYASMEQTPQTIERDSDTLAVLSLNLYNEARLDRGLPPVGRPLAPAQPDFLFAPPATTAPSVRPAGSTVPAGPAPAPSPTPLPPALVETAAGLVAMDADARARELASLPRRDRELLAADRVFVEQLRAGLSVEDFTAVAARLLVVVPDGVEQPEAARAEAEALVAGMLADPQIAVALLTGGRRLIVVPRNRPMTSLEEFAGLRGRHHPGGGRSFDVARGLFHRRRGLVGVGEENLLGESTDVLGDDFYDDGYSVARHEWAHAIESVLSAEDRQLIRDVYEAKAAADPPAPWDPYILTGFRQLWDRAEGELTGHALAEPEAELPTPPARRSETPEAAEPADAITRPLPVDVEALSAPPATAPRPRPLPVSAMMTEREFKQSTAAPGLRSSSRIADIDEELRAFHALPGSRQGARLLALKAIAESSRAYVAHKQGEGSRVEGTQRLAQQAEAAMRQLNPENVFRDLLTEIDDALRERKNPDLDRRSPAGEAQKAAQAVPSDRFHAMMSDYVHKLGRLRDDRTLPAETRAVIEELMAVEPLVTVMQYPRGGMPGIKLNSTGDSAEYTFNVDPQARGGTSFLLGHIAHEFTHVVAHQAFGSSPVMELVRSGATDAEVGSLAAERKRTLNDLKTALAGDREFSEFQQEMLQEKLVYGAQPRTLERYAHTFERSGKITTAQKERLVGWGEAAGNASGTLVEYDTVLNQMLIYLHMWQISQNNPFYVRLRAAAQAAYERRSEARGRGQSSSGESVLSAEDRQLIHDVYEAKAAADPPAQWPDGPVPNHSSSNAHEYFAQLSNAYLGANTGKDSNSRRPRNNGSDWVEQHDPALLPLLRRLYGPGRPSNLGSRDNPYILTGFRQLWDRAEGELTGHDSTPTSYDNVIPTQTRGVEVSDTVQQGGSDVHTEPETLPAPPPTHGDRRVVAALRQMFGSDIERRSDYAALYDAFRVLESAHAADYRAAGQSLDLDDVARRVLRLTSNEAILPDHFRALLQTVHSAARRDWAGSVGALAVYPVVRNTGALSHHTELRGPLDQYTGRNFTGRGGLLIDVSTVFMSMEDATGVPAPWRPRPHVVVAELDEASGKIVMDDGIGHRALLRDDELAALVGHDPIRPPHAEVLLLVVAPSGAADALPRLVADHAHTRVWATYGLFTLTSSGTGLRQIRLSESVHEPGNREPVGIFFPSDPGLGARDAVLLGSDGAEFLESDVHSYPLVTMDGQRLTWRVFLDADDTARLEWGLRELSSVRYYTDRDEGVPGTHLRERESGLLPLPRELANSYIAVWDGQNGRMVVPRRSTGRNQPVQPSQTARMLRRRPSLRRMPADHPVWILGCETLWQREGRDPVEFPNGGEVYATGMQRTVFGTDAQLTPEGSWGELPARLVKFDDPDRPAYRFQKFEPAPPSDALRELADLAGLPGDVARRTIRVLRWVRAMRLIFGDIDTDLSRRIEFRSLIRDFGALEMRRLEMSDPRFDSGPLTWHTLTQIGTEFARQMGCDPTMTPGLLHALLRAARERTLRLSVPVSQAAQPTTSNYDGDEWVDRPSGSGRRWLRADIVDDEAVPSSVTPDGELDESPDALFAPPARSAETEPSADVLLSPAPRWAGQVEETTRPAAQVAGELSGRSGVSGDAALPTGTVMPAPSIEPRPVPVRELPSTEEQRPAAVEAQAPTAGQPPLSQEEQLAERGLTPVYVLPGGDVLAHALTAVAPAESGRLAGHSWPAGPEELRTALADALAADLGLPPDEQRLWSAVAGQTGPSGAPLVTAFGGAADEAARALRTGSGPEATDWLTLAVAAPVLGLRLTVLTPDGSPWTTGPETGRPVALLQQENPAPYTARWAATEPTAQARQARRPDVSQLAGTSGYSWGTTSADSSTPPGTTTRPAATASSSMPPADPGARTGGSPARPTAAVSGDSARPAVFFGSEPRPSTPDSQRAGTSSGTPVTRTPPAQAAETSEVSAPVAESALTRPLAEETTTHPRTARDTRDEQDTDAVTILDMRADDGTDVVPAVPREEPPRTLSAYARPLPELDAPSPDPDAVPPRTDGVPAIVVTPPEGEVPPPDAHRDPDPAPTGAAPTTPVTGTRDPSPWYLAHGAMGQAIVAESTETIDFRREQADFWAEQISSRLDLTGPGPHIALRSGIRTAISVLLLTSKPKEWDHILAAGRTLVVDGRLVWLRPVMRDLTPVPRTKGEVNEYPVGFGSTATGGRSGHEVTQGMESTLLTLINLGTSVAASAAAVPAPQFYVGSSKSKDSGWLRTVLTGRKPFINDLARFGAGLQMKVFVDGADATPTVFHQVTVPDRIHIDIPTVYTGEEGHRPDYRAPEAERPRYQRASRPSQARELLQAIDLTPVIAGLHRNMRAAGLPASAAKKILAQAKMDRAQGFLTESTARSRYPWWAGGDSSNGIEVSGSLFGKFRGHLRIRREIDSLQYLGDSKVGTRDDIGVGEGSTRDSQGGSDAGFGFGYNTAGVGAGGDFSVDTDAGTSPHSENKLSVQLSGLAPAIAFKAGVNRDVGHSLDSSHTSHTVLNDFARQSRYRAGLRLEVTLESSTHRIAPVGVTTEGELSVPQREAAHFVRRTVGSGWTADLRPAAGGADAPRHRVFALPPSRRVSRLPETRPRFRFRMAVERVQGRLTPHPREPLALASRRGLGFGVPIALPGVETLQQDLRDAIERLHVLDVGAEDSKKSAWAQADRDLAAFYGRPALEGDLAQALLGIHRTIQVGKRRYKVSVKARWGNRIEEPSPLADPVTEESRPEGDFSMKVNTRAATGAGTAGERGKGWRAAVTFGGGARLAIPEYELSLGKLHFTTPPIRMQFGSVRGIVSSSREKSRKYGGAVGSYRRTETGKRIDEHRYLMAVNWTVTPEKKSRFKPSWLNKRRFLSGRNPFVARVVVPHEHVPATPVTPEQAQAAGHTVVGTVPTEVGRRLDFAGGAQGIYPVFHLMPELAQLGARMYAERLYAGERNRAKRQSLIDAWLDNPADWPQEIRELAHPMVLASHFGEEVGQGGYEKELPKDGKYKQALRLRLLVDNVNDLGADPETEVEQYLKGNADYESEQEGEWGAGVTGTLGPQLRFGSDAQDGDHPAGPGGRLTVLGQASVAWNWGKGASESDGRIDITRATYGGSVHTLRTDPVFELTYVRWRGDELTETTRYLRATEALDLLVPERRMSDILPPTTGTAAGSEPRQTRTYLDTGLLSGIAHPEVLRVDVLKTINDRLRARGIVRAEDEGATAPRPNLLQRSLKAAYSSEALQSEWHALTTEGVLRWFPVPGSWGTTRYLWVNVTATRLDGPHGQRPRDEIKLTLRGEAVEAESQSRDSGWEHDIGVAVRARAGNEKGHGGFEAEVEYSASKGTKDEDAEKKVGIYRATTQDPSEEFEHGITFRVEMGTTTELPEVLTTPAQGALSAARLFSQAEGPKGSPSVSAWYDPGDGPDQLVDGDVRLLVPRHLTVETGRPQQWPHGLTAPRETQVTWLWHSSQNPPAPALPDALVDNLHPWTVPAAASIGRWAKLTAVRHRIVPSPQVGTVPEIAGLDLTTTAGVHYRHRTTGTVMRPRIRELLKHAYWVPLGDQSAIVGLELDGAEILGPPEGVLLKQRRYHQADEEPTHETHRDSGWRIAAGPDAGGPVNDQKMLERLPIDVKNWEDSESRSAALGDTDERNAEGKRPYRAYRFDVTAVVNGPHGTVRIKVPGGLYGALPVDKNTGRLAHGLEDDATVGPLLRPAPPATETAAERATVTAGQEGMNSLPDTVRAQPAAASESREPEEMPSSAEQPPPSQEAQLAEQGLEPVYVLAKGDELAHALTAVAPGESGQLAGHSRPAGSEELRNGLADALAADLRRPPEERRLWPAVADLTGPEGTAPPLASGGPEEDIVLALRTGSGSGASDWLTLAIAAHVLGLRLTVLTPDGTPWTAGPDDGRPVVLLQQEDPGPYTARWAATEPAGAARQARRPSLTRTEESSDGGWGTMPSALSPPPSAAPAGLGTSGERFTARPEVFFGSDPRPAPPVPRPGP
ncbi:lonely Cys domain-containing protein [Streptomyces shenzhenensis]|uniref:lonely Cys domain-containing protein n=1 Tax=Streptomyces shenzhenensis TaxID=943815 RepID=UPI00367CA45E